MRRNWNDREALCRLQQWINDGKWQGTSHFRKFNSSLYEYLYRTTGMTSAFSKLGFDYLDFKKSKGKPQVHRAEQDVIQDLASFIQNDRWEGIRHLQVN